MKKLLAWTLVLSFALVFAVSSAAGDDPATPSNVPKLLRITKHELKTGKAIEYSSLVRQVREKLGDAQYHWIAATPITGAGDRVDIIGFYDNFAQIAEAQKTFMTTAGSLMQNVDFERGISDTVNATHSVIAKYRGDLSYHPEKFDIGTATTWDLQVMKFKPGGGMEFTELMKESLDLHKRANIDENWVAYEVEYGGSPGSIIFLTPLKSLADLDVDRSAAHKAVFTDTIKRRFAKAAKEDILSEENVILAVRPDLSRPTKTVVAANPTFWTVTDQGTTAVATKKKAQKAPVEPAAKKE